MCYGVYIVSLHTSHREDDSSSYAESKVVASDEILYRERKFRSPVCADFSLVLRHNFAFLSSFLLFFGRFYSCIDPTAMKFLHNFSLFSFSFLFTHTLSPTGGRPSTDYQWISTSTHFIERLIALWCVARHRYTRISTEIMRKTFNLHRKKEEKNSTQFYSTVFGLFCLWIHSEWSCRSEMWARSTCIFLLSVTIWILFGFRLWISTFTLHLRSWAWLMGIPSLEIGTIVGTEVLTSLIMLLDVIVGLEHVRGVVRTDLER